jgi:TnpA family transposase
MSVVTILSTKEKKVFDTPPAFTSKERKRWFAFPRAALKEAEMLRSPTTKVYFLTAYGYFRCCNKFFNRQFQSQDLAYVAKRLGFSPEVIDLAWYQKDVYRNHRARILGLCGIREFDEAARLLIEKEIAVMVRSQLKPKHIFHQVLDILLRNGIEVPGYFSLAEIIGRVMAGYKGELTQIIEQNLTAENRELLDMLFEKEATAAPVKFQRYKLTLFKKFYQSTKPAKVKANTEDLATLRALFHSLEPVIDALNLSNDGVEYYAQSVLKFQVFQMLRRSDADRSLHLIAFIAHQYFKLQDGLVDTLVQVVQRTTSAVSEQQKSFYFSQRDERRRRYSELLDFKKMSKETFERISSLLRSGLPDAEKLAAIEAIVMPLTGPVAPEDEEPVERDTYYAFLKAKSLILQKRVSDIIRQVEFQPNASFLMEAITYYKARNGQLDRQAPVTFLEPNEQELVFEGGRFQVSLYKALFFKAVGNSIKAGTLNLRYSYRYRSLDEYMIPKEEWVKHRAEYLKRAELEKFADPDALLGQLSAALNEQYIKTNTNILEGENPFIKFHHGTFSLTTPPAEESDDLEQTLSDIFPKDTHVSLLEVLATVHTSTRFIDRFEHFQNRNLHEKPSDSTFFAGIIGYGCNHGLRRIAQVSPRIDPAKLDTATTWYFSLDNINNASDDIIALTASLDLPNSLKRNRTRLHTASDGQKYDVGPESLNASPSYKYFGQGAGSSIISFLDERNLLFHGDVINSSEREAPYDIDGLMHNNVVKSDIHSTDMHGYSEAIFGATHLLGFYFAPRLKRIGHQQLYAFERRKVYQDQGFKILPHKYVTAAVIIEQWDDMLRLIATIKLKLTPASQIFKRLNSYSKQHRLYQALKAFGQIIKTLFILTYIDDVELRQSIEKQLNKVEHAQKFAKAVYHGGNQEFLQATKEEQEKAEACKRLIQNAIILWNYLYLSKRLMEEKDRSRRRELLKIIRSGSVVTWAHVHLQGEYDFSTEKMRDSVGFDFSQILAFKLDENWEK